MIRCNYDHHCGVLLRYNTSIWEIFEHHCKQTQRLHLHHQQVDHKGNLLDDNTPPIILINVFINLHITNNN